jgi:TRAP transporter TAXI family solute receptor
MKFVNRRSLLIATATALLACANAPQASAQTLLRAQCGSPGSSSFVFMTTFQTIVQQNLPVQINVTSGAAATRSTLDAARDQLDLFISSPAINYYMSEGKEMFAKTKDAPELFKNIRSIVNFPLGPYHIVTYESSGIKTLKDLKGKRLFLGPPGGSATVVALAIMEGATGYKPGVDYEQARLDWTSGQQAFQDKQVDAIVVPTELPSPMITQFALLDKIRLISIPDDALTTAPMKKILAVPGRTMGEIKPGTYGPNQVNTEPTKVVESWVGLSTSKTMDEDLVYKMTKALFEHIDQLHASAPFMASITKDTALSQVNAPLHKGALKYYREIGLKIDPALIPPEAK